MGGDAYSAEFVLYRLLGRDAGKSGTDILTFRGNLIAPFCLVDIYRTIEARSVSYIRCHQHMSVTFRRSAENLS
jgi:hypothetical protein